MTYYLVHFGIRIELLCSPEIDDLHVLHVVFFLQEQVLRFQVLVDDIDSVSIGHRLQNLFYDNGCVLLCKVESFADFIKKFTPVD